MRWIFLLIALIVVSAIGAMQACILLDVIFLDQKIDQRLLA